MTRFAFDLRQNVRLALSRETGIVVGRAEYSDAEPSYFVRYAAADGRQDERWWAQSALAAADEAEASASQA